MKFFDILPIKSYFAYYLKNNQKTYLPDLSSVSNSLLNLFHSGSRSHRWRPPRPMPTHFNTAKIRIKNLK